MPTLIRTISGLALAAVTAGSFLTAKALTADAHPDKAIVGEIEQTMVMPPGASGAEKYVRLYYLLPPDAHGDSLVGATYLAQSITDEMKIHNWTPVPGDEGAFTIQYNQVPMIADGGCGIVTLEYDPEAHIFLDLATGTALPKGDPTGRCNGYA